MRTWNLPGRGRLVEWKRDESHHASGQHPLFDPAGGKTHETYRYHLITDAGRVVEYRSGVYSVEDELHLWGHVVVGSQLLRFCSHLDTEDHTAEYEVRIELDRLQPEAEDPEVTARARAVVGRDRKEQSERVAAAERRIAAVVASFRVALHARRDTDRSHLVLDRGDDAPYPWVVRMPGGAVVWQTTAWDYLGKDLYHRIREIARELGSELKPDPELSASLSWTDD